MDRVKHLLNRRTFLKLCLATWSSISILRSKQTGAVSKQTFANFQDGAYGSGAYGEGPYSGKYSRVYLPTIENEGN